MPILICLRTCFCAVLRIFYVYEIFYASYDVTWWAGPAYVTAGFEASLGVICASVPSLKFYFQKFFDDSQVGISGSLASFNDSTTSKSIGSKSSQRSKSSFGTTVVEPKYDYRNSPTSMFSEMEVSSLKLGKKSLDESFGKPDLELGIISVTREVEVESVYNVPIMTDPRIFWTREESSPQALSSSERPLRVYLASNVTVPDSWLDEDSCPSTPTSLD
jgi:hypothetical protein